jgi:predicted peroxiredoxin
MASETLGILVTKFENREHIVGVAKAASAAGHPVKIFMTDEGVKFSKDEGFLELLKVDGVEIAVCDHSCGQIGINEKTDGISYGSQYNNARMVHSSARVLVF